jgi:hypothetical protein
MAQLRLSNGDTALIDDEDLDRVKHRTWHRHFSRGRYSRVVTTFKNENGKTSYVMLHRLVFNAQKGQIVDHINGNTLDNRKSNLRIVTPGQSMCNRGADGGRRFKGITYAVGKYQACISHEGKDYYLGRFTTAEEAARAYDRKAMELHGEFARLNYPAAAHEMVE